MDDTHPTFHLDGEEVPFTPGQTVMHAAQAQGKYIPHLCWQPDFTAHGSCKLCTVKVNGRFVASCSLEARAGLDVESDTPELHDLRQSLVQMLFVEGNHFCPSCEKSGGCSLQAIAYRLGHDVAALRPLLPQPAGRRQSTPTCCSTSTAASSASCACAPAATSTGRTSSRCRAGA